MELSNKVAIVTGCSRGIGYHLVAQLLHKGVRVAGWSRTEPPIADKNFRFYKTDVSNPESVTAAYQATLKDFGKDISILVNNAGIGYTGLIEEMSVEQWKSMFDINVNGVFYCTRLVVKQMKELGQGHIVNIGSIAGRDGSPTFSGYCGTKFALRGISQSLYKEVRDYGVKVSLIAPGSVQTNFFDNIEEISVNENMMRPEDVASSIVSMLETSENFHPVELEVRPLMPKGRKRLN